MTPRIHFFNLEVRMPMEPFRTILFAADFSENSKDAFRMACALAVENQTRLLVLHVLEPDLVPEGPTYVAQPTVPFSETGGEQGRPEAVKRRLGEVYAPAQALDVEYHTRLGAVSEEVLRMADEVGAELIAMGTHGRTGLRRLLAGSVAIAVLRGARCSVLALRSHDRPREASAIRVILHPTDFSDASEAALRVARSLARDLGARLLILHVMPSEIVVSEAVIPVDPATYRNALEAMRERLNGPDLKYPVEVRLGQGTAADESLRAAQEAGCDLIVMGTHARTGLGRLLMGSVAESVLPRADCPVIVVKGPARESESTPGRTSGEQTVGAH
jgi:nucleotide-binding universal stress UspA family protein